MQGSLSSQSMLGWKQSTKTQAEERTRRRITIPSFCFSAFHVVASIVVAPVGMKGKRQSLRAISIAFGKIIGSNHICHQSVVRIVKLQIWDRDEFRRRSLPRHPAFQLRRFDEQIAHSRWKCAMSRVQKVAKMLEQSSFLWMHHQQRWMGRACTTKLPVELLQVRWGEKERTGGTRGEQKWRLQELYSIVLL